MTAFNDTLIRACRREPVERIPVWFMRQAGRYQPEYRAIRERYSIKNICKIPEICAGVTLLPVQQLGVDAAILFSDIAIPLEPMGIDLDFREGVGPVIGNPVHTRSDIQRLRVFEPAEEMPFIGEAITALCRSLRVPLIGFTGAPFTLACYLVEGRSSKEFAKARGLMYSDPQAWHDLMERLATTMMRHLRYQVQSGATVLQIFDSWVGNLTEDDFREYILPHMQRMVDGLRDLQVPVIYFGVGTGHLLEAMKEVGSDVLGIDWRTPLDHARRRLGTDIALQGNLDPAVLFAPQELVANKTNVVLRKAGNGRGFIFNLGHGVLPGVNSATLRHIVDIVHAYSPVESHA